jgi:TonB family protein
MRAFILTFLVFGALLWVGASDVSAQLADRPLKILSKPNAKTDGDCGRSGSGRARLRVTFDKTAVVTMVENVELSGCQTFDRNAVKAAKKIKFQTAVKNGEAITVTRLIEYKYEIV